MTESQKIIAEKMAQSGRIIERIGNRWFLAGHGYISPATVNDMKADGRLIKRYDGYHLTGKAYQEVAL